MTPQGIDTIIDYHAKCGKPTVAFRDFAGRMIGLHVILGRDPRLLSSFRPEVMSAQGRA